MNADTWLRLATDGLPDAVKTRVAQDTREHLEDAELDTSADVDPVLGAPEDTAKELKRLYLTDQELTELTRDPFPLSQKRVSTGVLTLLMTYLAFVRASPFLLLITSLCVLGVVMAWRLPPLRQRHWLSNLPAFLYASYLMMYAGQVIGVPQMWITLLVTALLCWRAAEFWRLDQKLRRTLKLTN